MAHSKTLRRLGTLALAAVVGTAAMGAGRYAGVPDLAGSLAVAGSLLASPAAAIGAADRLFRQEALPAAQTEVEDAESPPVFTTPAPEELLPAATPEPQPEGAQEQAEPAPTPGPPPEGMGTVVSAHYEQGSGAAYIPCAAGTIKNCTSLSAAEVAEAAAGPLPFSIEVGSSEPQVLIMHTHATESYELEDLGWFDPEYTSRRTDTSLNMVAVGAAIAEELSAAGIVTLQDATLHDYPSYNGSYERSNATVRSYLEQYPSIKVVLDVHRDAIETDGARVKAVAEVEGKTAAQVMIICGADKNGNLPNFKQNLAFAAKWESAMESRYPGLTRPVLFDYRYYNQDLTTGSLLIEMGSHGNTLEEAVYSGHLVGKALVGLFTTGA
ncbi:stage II sporulation protein P [Candidatus Allofournierella merdipullorum]|uniref:stage II sporulation protein P n=1 Tax=Candidatus Allofournierella merdipullorum TaxID=2838595 RepID=UPI002A898F70|nr:stage II sporulation protein P [Candidatus Fournierella merdipullorum]